MARNGIISPRFLTTEPNEHRIVEWRISNMEATALKVNQMNHAATNITRDIFASGLQISGRKQNGYNSTL